MGSDTGGQVGMPWAVFHKEKVKVKEKEKEPKKDTKDKDKEKKVRFQSTHVNTTVKTTVKTQQNTYSCADFRRPKKRRAERPTEPVPRANCRFLCFGHCVVHVAGETSDGPPKRLCPTSGETDVFILSSARD